MSVSVEPKDLHCTVVCSYPEPIPVTRTGLPGSSQRVYMLPCQCRTDLHFTNRVLEFIANCLAICKTRGKGRPCVLASTIDGPHKKVWHSFQFALLANRKGDGDCDLPPEIRRGDDRRQSLVKAVEVPRPIR